MCIIQITNLIWFDEMIKAYELDPTNKLVQHNIALLEQGMAQFLLEKIANSSQKSEDIRRAIERAERANTYVYDLCKVQIQV